MGENDLLTTQEALTMLDVSRSTLYVMIRDGDIAPVRPKAALKRQPLKFRRGDIERILAERARRPEQT